MKDQQIINKKQFEELYKHEGSASYEVFEIIPKQNEADYFELDSISKKLFIDSFFEPKSMKREEIEYNTLKINLFGNRIDKYEAHTILNDGTMWNSDYFVDWVINGDTIKYNYLDPLNSEEKKDFEKWLVKFKELYDKASYVYLFSSDYFFKIEDQWHIISDTLEESPADFRKEYPPKEDQDVRMIELQDLAPEFYHEGHPKRDTSLIKMVAYESAYFEKVDEGLNQYNFSAGWWYLEIPMPLGDTIRIKRYSNYEDPELLIYKVPGAYGGREDVLFIIQKPEELFPDQVGGMYAIRPRDPNQPQRRYKSISYGDTSKGQPHILRAEETEEYKQWKSTRKD